MTRPDPPTMELMTAMTAQAEAAAELLRTLGNAQRLRILCLLVEGERSVGEINERISLSQSALSQHLAVLRDQRLVSTRREAQSIIYSLVEGPAVVLLQTLHALYCPSQEQVQTERADIQASLNADREQL